MKTIKIKGWEYEIETHDFNKKLSDIKIKKGWQLWNVNDCIELHNNWRIKANLEDSWFFIEQPFNININYVAWFGAYSDRAYLICGRIPSDSDSSLGVRFKRKIK